METVWFASSMTAWAAWLAKEKDVISFAELFIINWMGVLHPHKRNPHYEPEDNQNFFTHHVLLLEYVIDY